MAKIIEINGRHLNVHQILAIEMGETEFHIITSASPCTTPVVAETKTKESATESESSLETKSKSSSETEREFGSETERKYEFKPICVDGFKTSEITFAAARQLAVNLMEEVQGLQFRVLGRYILNVNHISDLDVFESSIIVHMTNNKTFTIVGQSHSDALLARAKFSESIVTKVVNNFNIFVDAPPKSTPQATPTSHPEETLKKKKGIFKFF